MSFKASLKQGQAGEARFGVMFPALIATNGKFEDFYTKDGLMIELKTESRTTAETPNLALELNSSEDRPGAVERAANDGMAYIVFLFADDKYFVYRPLDLLRYMYSAVEHRQVMVRNSSYRTLVMLVPRESVKHLEVTQTFKKELK